MRFCPIPNVWFYPEKKQETHGGPKRKKKKRMGPFVIHSFQVPLAKVFIMHSWIPNSIYNQRFPSQWKHNRQFSKIAILPIKMRFSLNSALHNAIFAFENSLCLFNIANLPCWKHILPNSKQFCLSKRDFAPFQTCVFASEKHNKHTEDQNARKVMETHGSICDSLIPGTIGKSIYNAPSRTLNSIYNQHVYITPIDQGFHTTSISCILFTTTTDLLKSARHTHTHKHTNIQSRGTAFCSRKKNWHTHTQSRKHICSGNKINTNKRSLAHTHKCCA